MMTDLGDFVRESNRIEGILRDPTDTEVDAHLVFIRKNRIDIQALVDLVSVLQPDARLRDSVNIFNVRVGNYVAPLSGPKIRKDLERLLNTTDQSPYETHVSYEALHPFTDGNGRSGRALWLWMREGRAPLGFLHHWYYESLQNSR